MAVYPALFSPNMTYPYDSFNVEDLHTVDNGVIRHLFPLLEDKSRSWDAIVGHFLGVDHVGHRVGPDHPLMKDKLEQMDSVLRRVVDHLEDDTLLVVLGDHGMDRKGDHGGDDVFETSATTWIYSKGRPLVSKGYEKTIPVTLLPKVVYPQAPVAHRWVQQIDLVPTLSLLLGLPIPYNNLGTVIPELFARPIGLRNATSALEIALKMNADQIKRYLDSYRSGSSGGELDAVWSTLEATWTAALASGRNADIDMSAYYIFTRLALDACRSLWAQFNVLLMSVGLVVLAVGVATVAIVYHRFGEVADWERWASKRVSKLVRHVLISSFVTPIIYVSLRRFLVGISVVEFSLAILSLTSCVAILLDLIPSFALSSINKMPIILLLHTLIFLSNSFTFWEDHAIPFLLVSCLVPAVWTALTSPDSRLCRRILLFSALYTLCVRLVALSTVCREEQQPYCRVTFYASSSLPSPPFVVLILSIPASLALPFIIRRVLSISKSDQGLVPRFLFFVLLPSLVAGNVCWILEWLETSDIFGSEKGPVFRTARTIIARCTFGGLLMGATTLWWLDPLCLDIRVSQKDANTPSSPAQKPSPKVMVVLNSNSYGSPYLLFWCIFLALTYLTVQLTGQLVLFLITIAVLAHLEISDSVRDVEALNAAFSSSKLSATLEPQKDKEIIFSFAQVTPFALLAMHAFFGTGHQSTLSSLQWKAAFLLTPTLSYPSSAMLAILNTFGPQFILALAVPLLACWQMAPTSGPSTGSKIIGGAVRAAIGLSVYFSVLLLSSAASSAWLRRHLMVWKVFAPRFMLAAVSLVVVDLALIIGVGIGIHRGTGRLNKILVKMDQSRKA